MAAFAKCSGEGYIPVSPGIFRKTLVSGERTLLTEFRLKKGAELPLHSHPHEQTGYLVSGRMILTIGDEVNEMREGDSWVIPGNVTHRAEILADSLAVEIFSPVREDYLLK
jgi:quercetin dioxygenase-like cupin family protein